ncbi:N-acetylglucosamine-specific PTS transporter subunit IIBC [Sphingopyxis indica]|uniref:N-acetylglucosamine-specific PTS transporter subunit IIBC n=1 Tax=Sphingopyxis indica TaxID=436663 RepID=UPI0029392639|nr:N-acetylglucosamine-specific PTS transporter subunit IIBC [Sphingopyxis indica]WOF42250.1 N-acetylglucosamine-specific PTS transporter subunit IIBC [Sphingopyxis indica]
MSVRTVVQNRLQPIGRALMLPIAVLPVAALLLRFGQPDLLGLAFVASAGSAIFANLGLLFAIGVGVGLSKENHGSAGLAGAVAYLVLTEGARALMAVPPGAVPAAIADPAIRDTLTAAWKSKELAKLSVPAGIIAGLGAGYLYNRFHAIRLPEYLAFFGGRRFVPIAAGLFGLLAAPFFGLGFPLMESAIDHLSQWVIGAGSVGLFLYGVLNRLLIVTGLHHILNNLAWFVLGDFHGASGDLNRFFAGDPAAGAFMSGFFPVMMFGLPAACLAMYRAAPRERRPAVLGMMSSMALTSFLTGVTEPIEFSFMFVAPLLYALHAVLTGVSMVVMDLIGAKLGFGFSAGLFDYLLNFRLSTRPLLLLPVGAVYFGIYYASFSFAIRRFGIMTPGRDPAEVAATGAGNEGPPADRAGAFVAALGGRTNLLGIEACTTRLRLTLADRALADPHRLTALGSKGMIAVGDQGVQVVVGPEADLIASQMRAHCDGASRAVAQPPKMAPSETLPSDIAAILGGMANIASARRMDRRWVVTLRDWQDRYAAPLNANWSNRWTRTAAGAVHLILD